MSQHFLLVAGEETQRQLMQVAYKSIPVDVGVLQAENLRLHIVAEAQAKVIHGITVHDVEPPSIECMRRVFTTAVLRLDPEQAAIIAACFDHDADLPAFLEANIGKLLTYVTA